MKTQLLSSLKRVFRDRVSLLVLLVLIIGVLLRVPYVVGYKVFYHDEPDWAGPGISMILYRRGYYEFNGYYFLPHHPILTCLPFGAAWLTTYPSLLGLRLYLIVQYVVISMFIYIIFKKLFGQNAGFIALLVYSISPLYVNLSMTITPESGISIMSVLAVFYMAYSFISNRELRSPYVVAILAFVFLSEYVYPAVLVAAMIISYILIYRKSPGIKLLLLLVVIVVGGIITQHILYNYILSGKTSTIASLTTVSSRYTRAYIKGIIGDKRLLIYAMTVTIEQLFIVFSTLPTLVLPVYVVLARILLDINKDDDTALLISLSLIIYILVFIALPRARYLGPVLLLTVPLLLDVSSKRKRKNYIIYSIFILILILLSFISYIIYAYYKYVSIDNLIISINKYALIMLPLAIILYIYITIKKNIDISKNLIYALLISAIILNPIMFNMQFIEARIPENDLASVTNYLLSRGRELNNTVILIAYKDVAYTLYVNNISFVYGGFRIYYNYKIGYTENIFLQNVTGYCIGKGFDIKEITTADERLCILSYVSERNLSAVAVDLLSARHIYNRYGFSLVYSSGKYAVYTRGIDLDN